MKNWLGNVFKKWAEKLLKVGFVVVIYDKTLDHESNLRWKISHQARVKEITVNPDKVFKDFMKKTLMEAWDESDGQVKVEISKKTEATVGRKIDMSIPADKPEKLKKFSKGIDKKIKTLAKKETATQKIIKVNEEKRKERKQKEGKVNEKELEDVTGLNLKEYEQKQREYGRKL